MSTIDLGSAFDAEIAATADLIKALLNENADFCEIEQAQVKLRELIAAKRSYLYSPKDPSYFIDQLFSSNTPEDRRKRAAELEVQILDLLESLSTESSAIQETELPSRDLLLDVLSFLRYFKHEDITVYDADPTYPRLIWAGKHGLTRQALVQALHTAKFITLENATLLAASLEDYKAERKAQRPKIDWDGSKESLTTFLLMSYYLGILNPDTLEVRQRTIIEDAEGTIKAPIPPVADIIASRFAIRGRKVSNSDISRSKEHGIEVGIDKMIVLELGILYDHLEGLAEANGFKKQDQAFDWDDMLYSLFRLLDDGRKDLNSLTKELERVDLGVLRILNDLHNEHYHDRLGLSEDLARL